MEIKSNMPLMKVGCTGYYNYSYYSVTLSLSKLHNSPLFLSSSFTLHQKNPKNPNYIINSYQKDRNKMCYHDSCIIK